MVARACSSRVWALWPPVRPSSRWWRCCSSAVLPRPRCWRSRRSPPHSCLDFGYTKPWPSALTWALGYGAAALAGLARGVHGTGLLRPAGGRVSHRSSDWRFLFSRAHAIGLVVFAVIVSLWQLPFYLALGWEASRDIWVAETLARLTVPSVGDFLLHFFTFPLELPLACFLVSPASPLFHRTFDDCAGTPRSKLSSSRWPSWRILRALAAPGARTRYFMGLYPCCAVLAGWSSKPLRRHGIWLDREAAKSRCERLSGHGCLCRSRAARQPYRSGYPADVRSALPLAVGYASAVVCLIVMALRSRRADPVGQGRALVLVMAGFLGVTYNGVFVSSLIRTSVDTASQVAIVKQALPEGTRLVSFGLVSHLFAYQYGAPIEAGHGPIRR